MEGLQGKPLLFQGCKGGGSEPCCNSRCGGGLLGLCSAGAPKKIELELRLPLPVSKFRGNPGRGSAPARQWDFRLHVRAEMTAPAECWSAQGLRLRLGVDARVASARLRSSGNEADVWRICYMVSSAGTWLCIHLPPLPAVERTRLLVAAFLGLCPQQQS